MPLNSAGYLHILITIGVLAGFWCQYGATLAIRSRDPAIEERTKTFKKDKGEARKGIEEDIMALNPQLGPKETEEDNYRENVTDFETKNSDIRKKSDEKEKNEKQYKISSVFDFKNNHRLRRSNPDSSPESEPITSEPESESTSKPEGESEPESNTKPESESEPKPEAESWPEPEPDWSIAPGKWQVAWPLHVYGFAVVLIILGLISLFELIRIHLKSRRKTALKVSLLTMIFIFCCTRSVALIIDPYGSKRAVNPTVMRLLFSIGQPCIISSMSLLLLVLIDTTKMNVAPPTFQRVQFIIAVVVCHVILVLTTDIIVGMYLKAKVLILLCQLYFLITGIILTIGYAKVGYKISRNSSASLVRDEKMEKLKILIAMASFIGFIMICLTIYGAAGVFGVYTDVMVVDAWPWWAFQTIGRTLEVAMVITILQMTIKVSGTGFGLRQLIDRCKGKKHSNKVNDTSQTGLQVISVAPANSWLSK